VARFPVATVGNVGFSRSGISDNKQVLMIKNKQGTYEDREGYYTVNVV
jgi:hypothetical protein